MLRCYITHKRGENDNDIADSFAYDIARGRYAISDGVTQSYIPHIWSKTLVNYFVNGNDDTLFVEHELLDQFNAAKHNYISNLDEKQLFRNKKAEKVFKNSAATFAGVIVKDNVISCQVIGDSCVFIIPSSGPIRCISSLQNHTDIEGHIHISFDNYPDCIYSDGSLRGSFVYNEYEIDSCYVLLMTDAISEWFVKQINENNNPLKALLEVQNNLEFENWVNKECNSGRLKSDDTCVLILDVDKCCDLKHDKQTEIYNNEVNFDTTNDWENLCLWMS